MTRHLIGMSNSEQGLELNFSYVAEILENIESFPKAYKIIFEDVRRAVVHKFPYLVLYIIEPSQVVVMAVFHSKRDPQVWQDRV